MACHAPTNNPPILVSACLAGIRCRYDGGHCLAPEIESLVRSGAAIPVCPEKLGGLKSPHPPCEIRGGGGEAVLDGQARVWDNRGRDVTSYYIRGAEQVLKLARARHCREARLKSKSPACGCGRIFNGEFDRTLIPGNGVTAALLLRSGMCVKSVR